MSIHQELISLIVAYTITGAFVFTVVVTCLSLVGWIRFANQKQQQKLFYIVIVELVTMGIGAFSGWLQFNPRVPAENIEARTVASVESKRKLTVALQRLKPEDWEKVKVAIRSIDPADASTADFEEARQKLLQAIRSARTVGQITQVVGATSSAGIKILGP